jgi:hypothetical protein
LRLAVLGIRLYASGHETYHHQRFHLQRLDRRRFCGPELNLEDILGAFGRKSKSFFWTPDGFEFCHKKHKRRILTTDSHGSVIFIMNFKRRISVDTRFPSSNREQDVPTSFPVLPAKTPCAGNERNRSIFHPDQDV